MGAAVAQPVAPALLDGTAIPIPRRNKAPKGQSGWRCGNQRRSCSATERSKRRFPHKRPRLAEGIAKPLICCSFTGIGQIQPGNTPNILVLASSFRTIQTCFVFEFIFTKREDLDVSSAWLPRLRQRRLHHLLGPPSAAFHRCIALLQRPLPPCFDPITGLGHPSRWQFFASGPNIRSAHRIPPPRLCAWSLPCALRFCARGAPRDQPEK
jgi:hypothetical protein